MPHLFADITGGLEGQAQHCRRGTGGRLAIRHSPCTAARSPCRYQADQSYSRDHSFGAGAKAVSSQLSRPWETHYNGWSWAERRAVTPIQNALFRSGKLARPTVCSICGFSNPARVNGSGYIFAHLERYDRPEEIYPVCKKHHADLHARFREPERWVSVVRTHGRPSEWFVMLTLDPASQWRPFEVTYPDGLPRPSTLAQTRLL